jgi:polar amino acid transport system substrate-binding protein
MRGRTIIAALAMACGLGLANAQALLVDVDDANPPFMFAREGRAVGVYPALMAAVFKEMKADVSIVPKPWRRTLSELDAGIAGVGGIYKNSERLKRYDYSEPMFVERVSVYSLRADTARYAGVSTLKGKRVGVIRGWSYGDDFDEARRAGTMVVEEVNSDAQNFAKLAAGRLDVVLAIVEAAEPHLRTYRAVQLAGSLAENPTYLAFNKSAGRQAFIEQFNAALSRMKKSGAVARIVTEELHRP